MDTKNEEIVEAQNEMMLFLHGRGFNVPKPEKNVLGYHKKAEKLSASPDDFLANNGMYCFEVLTGVTGCLTPRGRVFELYL